MNATNEISYVELRAHRKMFSYTESFALRRDRPCVWLQRLCVWIMKKLGAFHQYEEVTYSRHLIDAARFMEQLFKQRRDLQLSFDREPKELLIGAEDYEKLMGCDEITRDFAFNASYHHSPTGHRYDSKVLGLKVRVIPWMRGVLVMP